RDEGGVLLMAVEEGSVQRTRRILLHAGSDLDTRCPQTLNAPPCDRVRIERRDYDTCDARSKHRVRARRCATMVVARLERNVQRRTAGLLTGSLECDDLRVRTAILRVPPLADDFVVVHDHGTHHRIRPGTCPAA